MYKQDKIGVDIRIDGMTGELSYDIESIDAMLRRAKTDVDQAYDAWLEWHKS